MKLHKMKVQMVKSLLTAGCVFLNSFSAVCAEVEVDSKKVVNSVSYEHVVNWAIGLVIVLCLFFACVWIMRKMGTLPIYPKDNMKVIAGLSLGMREKLVLVQVGSKQLVLGVTPGKIENLLVLEGNEQLFQEQADKQKENEFSQKLKQLMNGSVNE